MKKGLPTKALLVAALAFAAPVNAQNNGQGHAGHYHDHNVTFVNNPLYVPNASIQKAFRHGQAWQDFAENHTGWWVEFNEDTGMPRRAMGSPIAVNGSSDQNKALNFITNELGMFNIPTSDLEFQGTSSSRSHSWVRFYQKHNGMKVFDTEMVLKLTQNNEVIMFGATLYNDITLPSGNQISASQAEISATMDLTETIDNITVKPDLMVLPVPGDNGIELNQTKFRLVYEMLVEGHANFGIPVRYYTLVDAHDGTVWYRSNLVMHSGGDLSIGEPKKKENKAMAAVIEVDLEGTVYTTHAYDPSTVTSLANANVTINGNTYQTDLNGFVSTSETGPATATFELAGLWSTVVNNGNTPSFTATVNDGTNVIDWTGNALIQEISAYNHVNDIHDHCVFWLPTYTGMNFSLTTNVDLTSGTCNAFYNGSSINFYADGGGCLTYANVADVVYHEYGHGINDNFYSDNGSFFMNGAMGEGYADWWAMSLTLNPILGVGGDDTDPTAFIRRYDSFPKVYPDDIVGEVHADGEIICGAWWDTYLNMGSNMNTAMQLFADAYYGLQAATANGNEGTAFTDVLIDVLQADDVPANGGDNDITNGTPNGLAIVDGFALHGITLISTAELAHTDLLSATGNTPIDISADLTLTFPYNQYLGDVTLNYAVNNAATYSQVSMTNTSGNTYEGQIPSQPIGTIVRYYISTQDINGQVAAVEPIGAASTEYPNTPFFILVGYSLVGEDDVADFNSDFGAWTVGGVSGDNATTGVWEMAIPTGSFSDLNGDGNPDVNNPDAIVQTDDDHTTNGDFCFITGNHNSTSDGIGLNDVDGGHTTLLSPTFDLSINQNPTFSYWKWYTNNPPSGANPKADWWQVYISNDNGSTWVPIEDTKTGERKWRRYAFRVQDYVTPTSQVQLKFIASDSLRPGQNLDGGSLVEAAIDDVRLWDDEDFWSVDEISISGMNVYPNPAVENVTVDFTLNVASEVRIMVYNAVGQVVSESNQGILPGGEHRFIVSEGFAAGEYNVRIVAGDQAMTRKFSVLR